MMSDSPWRTSECKEGGEGFGQGLSKTRPGKSLTGLLSNPSEAHPLCHPRLENSIACVGWNGGCVPERGKGSSGRVTEGWRGTADGFFGGERDTVGVFERRGVRPWMRF